MWATRGNAARPEPRVVLGTGNFLAEGFAERAVHGGDVDPDLLEYPPVHNRHDAAAAAVPGLVRALPSLAFEASGRPVVVQPIFQRLETRADLIAKRFEPCPRLGLSSINRAAVHRRHAALLGNPFVCRNASANTMAPTRATIDRSQAGGHRHPKPGIRRRVHVVRDTGAFPAEQQNIVIPKREIQVLAIA